MTASQTTNTKKKNTEVFLNTIIRKKAFIRLITSMTTKQAKNRFKKKTKNTIKSLNISRK